MSRRKLENRSLSGLLAMSLQTQIRMDNFHNFYMLDSKELGRFSVFVPNCLASRNLIYLHDEQMLLCVQESYESRSKKIEDAVSCKCAAGGEIFNLCVPDLDDRIGESDIIRLIRQILEGLCCLHEKNIVHLDLKPQNILLSSINPLGDVKIVDFGMSRKVEHSTELRQIMGTTEYLEVNYYLHTHKTIISISMNIGVISYMLLTQESPFVGADNQETFLNISQVNVDYSEETFSSVSQPAKDFIQKLLIKNPEERPTAEACLSHFWLRQGDFILLCSPEESCCPSLMPGHATKCSEERNVRSGCNGTCSDKEDKENIPEDSSTVSKRFRFDDSLQYPQDFMTDFVC
uniref:Protein kinase domain-containing protein n=1 Tax=Pavo cristatus TaxID=9049 RepID=A0A8C9END4_PAVCR